MTTVETLSRNQLLVQLPSQRQAGLGGSPIVKPRNLPLGHRCVPALSRILHSPRLIKEPYLDDGQVDVGVDTTLFDIAFDSGEPVCV